MKKRYLAAMLPLLACTFASAETVLLEEDFNVNYTKSFPWVLNHDGQDPAKGIASLFKGTDGSYQPWWLVRDSEGSTEKSMASYSYFDTPGQSDKWLISVPLEIATEGFMLNFDAQSCIIRDDSRLCDLQLYITESLIDPKNLPDTPDAEWKEVPAGENPDELEGDWTHYSFDLSPYAGKTVYLNFANRNYDKDIIVIDNVKVSRVDMANLSVSAENYTTEASLDVEVNVEVLPAEGMTNWKLTLNDGKEEQELSGESLGAGEHTFNFSVPTQYDVTVPYTVTLTADGQVPVIYKGEVTKIAFNPQRRVLLEETTGMWCGYCPGGIYTIEEVNKDEELSEAVIPVCVHIPGAKEDYMVNEQYAAFIGIDTAPTFILNRRVATPLAMADYKFDKSNPETLGYQLQQESRRSTPLSVTLSADWVKEGNDTVAINAVAKVRSAMTISGNKYALGFILTENNVGRDTPLWKQTNYFDDVDPEELGSDLNGWTSLSHDQMKVRYQEVARGVWGFYGLYGSLPETLPIDEEVSYEYKIEIPNAEVRNSAGTLIAKGIQRQFCVLIAYVVDTETEEIVNACKLPMSDVAEDRFTTDKLVELLSVPTIGEQTGMGEKVYYNLQGLRVSHPQKGGIYIVRQGNKVSKAVKN